MQDYLGTTIEIGDYIFGGESSQLFKVTDKDKLDDCANVTRLGERTTRRVFLRNFVRISEEQLTLYFLTKGYKT
jgi:hypothetical protein